MLNDELRMSNKEPVTYSILNKEPGTRNQLHIANAYILLTALRQCFTRKPGSFARKFTTLHSSWFSDIPNHTNTNKLE